jgi:hypothetical protein
VRDVLRSVPEIAEVHTVYLNGDPSQDFAVSPGQVAVLTCIPLEYEGLTIAWIGPSQDGQHSYYRDVTMRVGEQRPARLRVTVPNKVLGRVSAGSIDIKQVELVDLDTGALLSAQSSSTGLEVQVKPCTDVVSALDPQRYTVPKSLTSGQAVETYFNITTAQQACGVYRIGAVVQLKVGGENVTLHSAQAEQYVTLKLRVAPLIDSQRLSSLGEEASDSPSNESSESRNTPVATG